VLPFVGLLDSETQFPLFSSPKLHTENNARMLRASVRCWTRLFLQHLNNLRNWWSMDALPRVKFLWLFDGSEVRLPDSATATQLCRRQYAHCVCRCTDACRLFRISPAACWCCSSSNLCSELCYKLSSIVTFTFLQTFDQNFASFTEPRQSCRVCLIQRQNLCVIFGVQFERQNVDNEANLHQNWSMQTLF